MPCVDHDSRTDINSNKTRPTCYRTFRSCSVVFFILIVLVMTLDNFNWESYTKVNRLKPMKPMGFKQPKPIRANATNEKCNSLPNWLCNAYPQKLNEGNQPAMKAMKKLKSSTQACPKYFKAYIKDLKPVYHLCDTVKLVIEARDCKNKTLTSGGDYLWAWLKTDSLKANQATDGNITDLGNGKYLARFTLRWTGKLKPVVAVIRTREEVQFMREWREKVPARFAYSGIFISKNVTVSTPCHLTPWMDLTFTDVKVNKTRHVCNFTDSSTGIPWYCIKPENMSCSAYTYHRGDTDREKKLDISKKYLNLNNLGTNNKIRFIQRIFPREFKVLAAGNTNRYSRCKSLTSKMSKSSLVPRCKHGLTKNDPAKTSGFYFKNVWISLLCSNKKFDTKTMLQTIQNKTIYFFGDSTLRQWIEYLTKIQEAEGRVTNSSIGRNVQDGIPNNISLVFKFHGFPIRGKHSTVAKIDYIANRLDAILLCQGEDVVIAITVWAHFTASTLDFYLQRLLTIKKATERLINRCPRAKVFIKSANTRELSVILYSNWYAWECDRLMRKVLGETPGITIIDVWDMTMGHNTGFHVHPKEVVVKNEVAMMLSYL